MIPETDLASRLIGGTVMAASDESFGDKENLLRPEPPVNDPGRYGNRGEIVDGWETRRRREPGHDWALIRLGVGGVISSIDVDTSFFTGNFPQACRIEAGGWEGYPGPSELSKDKADWVEILPKSELRGNGHNLFPIANRLRFTHLRLSIHPDGGVARLRVNGHVVPDPLDLDGVSVDLIGRRVGGAVVASSDEFYTSAQQLNRPDEARTMGEGWEARRRRDSGHDFVMFRLGLRGSPRQLIVDTAHFRYNATPVIEVFCSEAEDVPSHDSPSWSPLLGRTCLQPDTYHVFRLSGQQPVRWMRLDAFPDGGISRVRLIGTVDISARRHAALQWLNALPQNQATAVLRQAGLDAEAANELVSRRPITDPDVVPELSR